MKSSGATLRAKCAPRDCLSRRRLSVAPDGSVHTLRSFSYAEDDFPPPPPVHRSTCIIHIYNQFGVPLRS